MKVALPIRGNHIFSVCDSSRMLLVVEVKKGMVTSEYYEPFDATSPFPRAKRLSN
jgi:hypothetical protein